MRGTAVLLDIGANADCRPPHLVAFAAMGTVFARVGLGIAAPEVGVLSIGQEAGKGNELTREAHRLLRATPLRFVGNVEARDLYSGAADVVVCDGFTGNVVIKVSEGVVGMVERMLGEAFAAMGGEGARLAVDAVGHFRARIDYAEYGGAPLLGVGRPAVVAHGRSSARAVHERHPDGGPLRGRGPGAAYRTGTTGDGFVTCVRRHGAARTGLETGCAGAGAST